MGRIFTKRKKKLIATPSALILPVHVQPGEEIHEEEHWIGQIKEIRGRPALSGNADDPADIWALVEWFWSGEDVAEVLKTLCVHNPSSVRPADSQLAGASKPDHCAAFERLKSDTWDYVSSQCFNGAFFISKDRLGRLFMNEQVS
jgi:hypothetical protein